MQWLPETAKVAMLVHIINISIKCKMSFIVLAIE